MADEIPPRIELPQEIREQLESREAGLASRVSANLGALHRRCVYADSERVSNAPLRRKGFAKLLGWSVSAPKLSPIESKFGGTPYAETEEDWNDHSFLGQFDAGVVGRLAGYPQLSGLVRFDLADGGRVSPLRCRWFPEPSMRKAVDTAPPSSVGAWETKINFRGGWSLPEGNQWFNLVPTDQDDALWEMWNDWIPDGFNEDSHDDFHKLLGWRSSGLDEHYGFEAPEGCSNDISDYELLLRLTYDNQADFAWGTNWIYLIVPKSDLERGDLSRIIPTGANY